jgi:multidrug efflux pump subunit AcrA (membrane-fusion protein)
MRIVRWLLIVALTGCGAGGAEQDLPPTGVVARGTFDHTLTVTGELQAVNSQKIVTPNVRGSLKITELAEEGAFVKEGETIVRFDTDELERDLATLEADIGLTEQKIVTKQQEMQGNLADKERAVERQELGLERHELKVTDSETVSRIEREETRISMREAQLSLAKAKQDLAAAVAKGDADVELLRLELRKQEDRRARLLDALANSELKAPSDGIVILGRTWRGGKVAEGDTVWRGMEIMEFPDLSNMEILAPVHEVDASKVAIEQVATVRVDALPGKSWTGHVKKKANLAKTKRQGSEVKYFDVEIELDVTDEAMKPGMTAKVDLLIERLEDVLTVPREAIVLVAGKPTLYTAEGGRPKPVEVTVGPRNSTHVVIEEGVEEGDLIFLGPPGGTAHDGGIGDESRTAEPKKPEPGS